MTRITIKVLTPTMWFFLMTFGALKILHQYNVSTLSLRYNCVRKRKKKNEKNQYIGKIGRASLLFVNVRHYVIHGDVPSLVVIRVRSELRAFWMKTLVALPGDAQFYRLRVLSVDRITVAHRPIHAHRIVLKTMHTIYING